MAYQAQTSFRTQLASAGVVAALHGVVIVGLIAGFAAVQVLTEETHTEATNIPLRTIPPEPQPKAEAKPSASRTHETVIELPFPFKPAEQSQPVDTTPQRAEEQVVGEPVVEAKPVPKVQGVFTQAKPRGRPAEWATPDDYPPVDLRLDHEGTARFSLTIGPDGRVSGCTITGSSGFAGLDAATCQLITRRARFNPALDENGQPMAGSYSSAIRWVIPR